jgi:predicted nuclease of predicted toxin-antitoxin system
MKKFLIDAQLPYGLAQKLNSLYYDVLHTKDIPDTQSKTSDEVLISIATDENRIIISKDADFVDAVLITKRLRQLVYVTTGNIKNKELISIFENNISQIVSLLENHTIIEVSKEGVRTML